ncbi:MAG: hypothetical protein J7513_13325 [Solirubrobacteraceae bacterium]|nr:hypothetical protein [Solirubrobacteraceae bacterium]
MSCTRPVHGRSGRSRRARFALLALIASAGAIAPSAAQAADPPVTIKTVFASPVTPEEPSCNPNNAAAILANTALAPETTQAGASNDLCFGFTLPPGDAFNNDTPDAVSLTGDDMKTLAVTMPAGMAGSPDDIPKCSAAQFGAGNYADATCPDSSMVGTIYASLKARVSYVGGSGTNSNVNLGGTPAPTWDVDNERWNGLEDGGYLYNLEHGPNELALMGAVIQPVSGLAPAKFTIALRLASDGSGRVETVVDNAPKTAYYRGEGTDDPLGSVNDDGTLKAGAVASQLYVQGIGIRVWGSPGDRTISQHTKGGVDYPEAPLMGGKDFIQWGTDCSTGAKASVSMTTYAGVKSSGESNAITLNGCGSLPFTPTVSFAPTATSPSTPTGLDVSVALGQSAAGQPRTALLRDASVTMPAGLEIGAQVASGPTGLPLCSAAAFNKNSVADNSCPTGSKVGEVTIISPLVAAPFKGAVYLGEQSAVGELPPLYLQAAPEGSSGADAPRIKLVGSVKVDENGRMTTTFADAPQLRFSSLKLSFPGGDHALFITPRTCDQATGSATFKSWAGGTANVDASIKMATECDPVAFSPAISMVPASNAAGAKTPQTITIARGDRQPWLKDVKVTLPPGFLSDLTVVTECSKPDAAAASCPESSRIGTVESEAGVGPKPLSLSGSMYLVDRDEGSVAGAVIVVRAKIGELDLGNVVVPGKIDLSPTDAVLSLSTSAPLRFKGLALNLRSIVVKMDRDNFPLNPTSCGPLTASATITGDGGQTASPVSNPLTYANCDKLPFQPAFSAKLSGETKPLGHPTVEVTMVPRAGDSNLKSAKVVLPAGVSTDPGNLKNLCPQTDFYAGTCSEASRSGTVNASVAITNEAITGGVYLVKIPGVQLPGLGMAFSGRYTQRLLSTVKIDKDFRLIAEFASIPDLPLRRLEMKITGGAKGPIQLSPDACTADSAWEASFGAQGGQTSKVNIAVPCPITKTTQTWSRKSGLKLTLAAPTGQKFKTAKLTLPSGFKLKSGKSRSKYAKVKFTGGKGKSKLTSTSLSATAKGAGPTKVTYTISTKGYTLPKSYKGKLKKGKKIKFKIRTVTQTGTVSSKTLTVKVK